MTNIKDMIDRVGELEPLINRHAQDAESNRRLHPDVYQALRDAQLFDMLLPATLGGLEMHPVEVYRVWEAVGRVDSAAAWTLVMNGSFSALAAWLGDEGLSRLYADGPVTIAGALNPPCAAERADGGWRISGQLPFASGADHADWFLAAAVEMEGDAPKVDPSTGQPMPMAMLMPRRDAAVLDTWHTMGMRGTGSADLSITDVFIPGELSYPVGPLTDPHPAFDGAVARMFPLLSVHGESVISVAVAAAALDQLLDLAARKTPSYTALPLRERELAQVQVGQARARIDAARSYLYEATRRAHAEADAGSLLSDDVKIGMQLAACFAAEACAEAGRLVHAAVGSSGIRMELGFERHLRDLHTLTQHASKALPRYGSAGRMMFGLDNDWIFLSF